MTPMNRWLRRITAFILAALLVLMLTASLAAAQEGLQPDQIGPSLLVEPQSASSEEQNPRPAPQNEQENPPVVDPGINPDFDPGLAQQNPPLPGEAGPGAADVFPSMIQACNAAGEDNYTNATSATSVVRSCRLIAPVAGNVLVIATGTVDYIDNPYVAFFNVSVDIPAGDANYDRYVHVIQDATYGDSDRSISVSALLPVTAGVHTIYFTGTRYSGSGTITLSDPALSAVFIPSNNVDMVTCSSSGQQNFTTTSGTLVAARQCTFTMPAASAVFIMYNTGLALLDSAYEAHLRLGIDNLTGDSANDRWVDLGDLGGFNSAQVSGVYSLAAGTHTVYGLAGRWGGSGTVWLFDSALTVLVIPPDGRLLQYCSHQGQQSFTTTSTSPVAVHTCNGFLKPPGGWILTVGDGGMDLYDSYYEATFEPMVYPSPHNFEHTRWETVYPGDGSGFDTTFVMSRMDYMPSGSSDYTLEVSRSSGSGTIELYDPSFTQLYFPYTMLTLPAIMR